MSIRFTMAVFTTAVMMLSSLSSNAQITNPSTYDLRFLSTGGGGGGCGSGGSFCAEIQIKAANGAPNFAIGSHTVWFNYNKSVISNPVYTSSNFNASTQCSIAGVVNYNPYLSTAFNYSEAGTEGEANFTTLLNAFTAGFECPVVTSANWVTMGTVCFDVLNSTGNPGLYFSPQFTLLNMSNNQPQHNPGTWGTLNNLPSGGSSPGIASFSSPYTCVSETINFTATGYSVNSGYFIGLIVSDNSSINNASDFLAATKYLQVASATASAFNGPPSGTGFPVNTPLFVYSFTGVGSGNPVQIDPTCFSISPEAGPFVILQTINTNISDYVCLDGGLGTLNIVASGGMPVYNTSEKFTVSVQNATYAGPTQVSNNQILNITVSNNVPWTVTFTDSQGCQGVASGTFIASEVCGSCDADAGTVALSKQYVCWGDSVLLTASGYTLGDPSNGYVGLLVTPDASFQDLMNDVKYGLYAGNSAYHVNNVQEHINQTLYAHSFIGEGSPFAFDPTCYDLSQASLPIVLLGEVAVNASNLYTFVYDCNSNGTATIELVPTGGMPAYSPVNEKFTVTVTGSATYSGPAQVSNGATATFIIADGDWSVTFTDSKGCEYAVSDTFFSDDCGGGGGGGGVCNADAGTATRSKNYVCWGDQINFSASGYTLSDGPNSYVGFAVSNNGSLTSLNGANIVYTLQGPNATLTNNQLNSLGLPLYLYAFIGEGTPVGNIDANCTDLSAPTASFVLLQEVIADFSDYVCASGGSTAQVQVAAAGGMPLYQTGQQFSVSVSNAAYSGPTSVGNNQAISITVNNGATWSVTFTDSQGCSVTISDTYNSTTDCPAPPTCTANAGPDQSTCETSVTMAAQPAPAGGAGTWSVATGTGTFVSNISPTTVVNGLSVGVNKFVWSVSQSGCTVQRDTVAITRLSSTACNCCNSLSVETNAENATCGLANGRLEAIVSGGSGTYTETWVNVATNQPVTNLLAVAPGTYQLTLTDTGCGCAPVVQQVTVASDNNVFGLQATAVNVNDCENVNTGQVCVTIGSGGTAPFTILLNGTQYGPYNTAGSHCIDELAPGIYSVSVSDANGCQNTAATQTILQLANCGGGNECPTITVESTAIPVDCESESGQICFSVSGGTAPYSFGSGNSVNENEQFCITGLNANTYTFTITDANNCTATLTQTVTNLNCACCNSLAVDATAENASCGLADGRLEVSVSGGSGTYNAVWANAVSGQPVANPLSVAPGIYQLTLSDTECGCAPVVQVVEVNEDAPSFGIQTTSIDVNDCENVNTGQICVTIGSGGTAPFTISINGTEYGPYNTGSHCIDELAPGTYTISVSDANGCTRTASPEIIQQLAECGGCPFISVQSNVIPTDCGASNGQICLMVSGGQSPYTLTNGTTIEEGQQSCITGLAASTYSFTITDANGCTASHMATVVQPTNQIEVLATAQNAGCGSSNGSFCLTISGGEGPYSVSSQSANYGNFANNQENCVDNVTPGLYVLTVTDLGTNCTVNETVAIGQLTNSINISSSVTSASCSGGGGVCLTFTGGNAPYTVSGVAAITGSFGQGQQRCFGGFAPGTYNFTVTDNNGCSKSSSFTISGIGSSIGISSSTSTATCQIEGSVCFMLSGGLPPYTLSGTFGISTIAANGLQQCYSLPGGNYVVTVTDANGCTATDIFTIEETENNVAVNISTTPAGCSASGSVCFSFGGGTAPYTVSGLTLLNGSYAQNQQQCINGLAAGTYNFNVTDAQGCTKQQSFTISGANSSVMAAVQTTNPGCNNNDGVVCFNISGGTPPYQITGTGGTVYGSGFNGNQNCIQGFASGAYSFTITDTQGCTSVATAVLQPATGCGGGGDCDSVIFDCSPANTPYNFCPDFCDLTGSYDIILTNPGGTGNVTITNGGTCISFMPNTGFSGLATVYVVACSGPNTCQTITLKLTVGACGQAPTAVADAFTVTQGTLTCLDVLNNDYDVDGSSISVGTFTQPAHGFVVENPATGELCYEPDFGYTGTDSFTYTACDGIGCNQATVAINVTAGNNTTVCNNPANAETICTTPATPVVICVEFCNLNASGAITDAGSTFNCGLVIQSAHCIQFTPLPGQTGNNQLIITACDNTGACELIYVNVNISASCGNEPCNNPENLCTEPVTPVNFCLDFCNIGASAAITEVHTTYDCGLVLQGNTCLQYTPLPGFLGSDIIVATACDNAGQCETITIPVLVTADCNPGPEPCDNPDNLCTEFVTPIQFCVEFCDLNTTAQITEVHPTYDCGIVLLGNNCVQYTPLPGYVGIDNIAVTGCDNTGNCQTIYVHVNVTADCGGGPSNNPPVAVNDAGTTPQNTPISISVLDNDSDPDGDPFAITAFTQPLTGGTVTQQGNNLVFTPTAGFSGTATFTYTICDNGGLCDNATVTIVVEGPEPCDNPDNLCTTFMTPLLVCVEFCDLNTTAQITDVNATFNCGLNILAAEDCVEYIPLPGFSGPEVLEIIGCDNTGACQTIYVNVVVQESCVGPSNNPPVAVNDAGTTPQNTPISISVLDNDSDPDGDPITITAFTQPLTGGTVTQNGNNLVFTPSAGFSGTATFTYTICDNGGLCDNATVTITVQGPEPCDNPDNLCTTFMTPLLVCVEFCDLNASAQITDVNATFNCGLNILTAEDCVEYIPLPGFSGPEVLEIIGCDNTGACQTIYVNVVVQESCGGPSNNPPVAVNDAGTTPQNTPITVSVLDNDSDPDGDPFIITAFTQPLTGGTVTQNGNNLVFTPSTGFSGTATFTYTICDNGGLCDNATVTITVEGPGPCDNPDNLCTQPMTPLLVCVEFCNLNETAQITTVNATFNCGLNILAAEDCVQYTPLPGFFGPEVLEIIGCDNTGACDTIYVNVTVQTDCTTPTNNPPVAVDDATTTPENTPVEIPVLANDSDPDGDPITITASTPPAHGTITLNAVGTGFIYTPNPGYTGFDSFTYQICDPEGLCDVATVTIEIISDCPSGPPAYVCAEPMVPSIICPEFCDIDPSEGITIISVTATFNCGVDLLDNGCIQYTPLPGYVGQDSLVIIGCNSLGVCDTTVVYSFVTCAAPIAFPDFATTPNTQPITVDVLANDIGICSDDIVVTVVTQPATGSATVNADNNVVYTPPAGFTGTVTFNYTVCDLCSPTACDQTTVTITVTGGGPGPQVDAQPDVVQTPFNTPIQIDVLENDFGANLGISSFTQPENGTVAYSPDGTQLIYTPNPGFSGVDYFFYTVCDEVAAVCDETIVSVTVLPEENENLPPTANNDVAVTPVDTPVTIPVLTNDSDPEGTPLTVTFVSDPPHGTAEIVGNEVLYTPDPGFTGMDSFIYVICDAGTPALCDTAMVGIGVGMIEYPNNPPVANPDEAFTDIGMPVIIPILNNDSDPDGDPLTVTIGSDPAHGTVVLDLDNNAVYTPDSGYIGTDYFTYIICDDGMPSLCDTTWVTIHVGPMGVPPVAADDEACTEIDEPVEIFVLDNDTDADGGILTITILTEPANGQALVGIIGTSVAYIPDLGFEGTDTFTYQICDPTGQCDTASVLVYVNGGISLQPDIYYVSEGGSINMNVLENDLGAQLDLNGFTQPSHGMVVSAGGDLLTYMAGAGYTGTDYFFYQACDCANNCQQMIVTLIIVPDSLGNLPPIANNDYAVTTPGTPVDIPVLNNDSDPNGDPIIIVDILDEPDPETVGTPVIADDSLSIIFTPAPGFTGCTMFAYVICDNGTPALCDTAYVTVGIGTDTCLNHPPLALPDTVVTNINTPAIIDVLGNDSDPDGDLVTVTVANDPLHGDVQINSDNTITYLPETGFEGTDYFTYVICDNGSPSLCDTTYVVITIQPEPVLAQPDIYYTVENVPITVNILDNDFGDGIFIVGINTPPANGEVSIDDAIVGLVTYTPNPGFIGTDYFEYVICSTPSNCDTTLVTIIVMPDTIENLPPVAVNDVATTPVDSTVCVPVLANDFDPFGGTAILLSGFDESSVNGGTVAQSGDELCYTPPSGFTGLDSLTYIICDNGTPVLCDTATVVINVGSDVPSNNPPLAVDDAYTTSVDTPITVNILDNDSDPDGDLITVTFLSDPMMGTVNNLGDGNITYTPNPGATGTDFFSYIICDNGTPSLCDTAYVTITIETGPPSPLDAQPDIAVTAPDTPVVIDILDNDLGDPLPATIVILDQPSLGTVTIDPVTGLATYTPNPGVQDTTDYFVYQVCDATGNCDSTLVTIEILPADSTNTCPNAGNDVATTPQDTEVCINVLANDVDAFGGGILALVTFEQPANGTVVFQPDSILCYLPDEGFCGVDSFTYVICDNGSPACCDTALVVINVCSDVPTNNPPIAVDDVASTEEDVPVVINILGNDSDPDGDDLTVTFLSDPCGIATLNADGVSVTYTPLPGCGPVDYFSYVICDNGTPVLCDTAYVTITLIPQPLQGDTITEETPEDTPVTICVTDPAYGIDFGGIVPAVVVLDSPAANGTVTAESDTCITYTPNENFCGDDTFEITVCDTQGNCLPITVVITVTCVPDAPVAVDDSATTPEGTSVTIAVLGNDFDPDDPTNPDAIELVAIVDEPLNGIAVISGDSIVYTPDVGFTGCDTFTYVIQDLDDLLTDTAQVVVCVEADTTQITVIAVNDSAETTQDTPVTIAILDNDTYPGEGVVTVQIITNPLNGSATATETTPNNWEITYTPNSGFTGIDSLQYVLCETPAGSTEPVCDTAWVFINIASCELLFASGFSPNEDGVNDTYIISNLDNLSECFPNSVTEMTIFNRWGDVVYKKDKYSNNEAWDGTWYTSGEPVPDGTYFYCFVVRDQEDREQLRKQGYIEVHR